MAFLAQLDKLTFAAPSDDDDVLRPVPAPAPSSDDDVELVDEEEEVVDPRPSLDAFDGFALGRRLTLEAGAGPFPWDRRASRAADHGAGVAAYAARAPPSATSAAAAWRRASTRWEYAASARDVSIAKGDCAEWCLALHGAYETWRAEQATHVYARCGGLCILWCRLDEEQTMLCATLDGAKKIALRDFVDVCSRGRVAVSEAPADGEAHVVVGRGATACRATLNYALRKGVGYVAPPPMANVDRGYAVLSDGAFLHASLKPLTVVFNRVVKIPEKPDVHRFVTEGWICPTARAHLRTAATFASARSFVEVDDESAPFDRPDVARKLADLVAFDAATVAAGNVPGEPPGAPPASPSRRRANSEDFAL